MTDEQIKYMVNRFLGWNLPQGFNPDGGISYKRPNYEASMEYTPTGTNLLDINQAEVMIRYITEGMDGSVMADDGRSETWKFPDGTVVTMTVPQSEPPITVKHAVFCLSSVTYQIHKAMSNDN
jgi:hypothetical protein